MRQSLKIGGIVVVVLLVLGAAGFALGVLGVPSVAGVDNQFGSVNESSTIIYTDLQVNNPNPIGVRLGGLTIDYTVSMNGVSIANGTTDGVEVEAGNSTLNLTTAMNNEQIPAWWYTHIDNGETTEVDIDARADSSLGQASFGRSRMIETDIAGQFDSNETRPVNGNIPLVSDPVLYINSTRGSWDQENLTRDRTPLDMDFTVYNPKDVSYTVSKIGYNITMNGVPVGAGETERAHVIESQTSETIRADTAIDNARLDEWWVTHLERNQVTDLYIDFYLIVDIGGEQFRIDLDSIDYEKRIETDIFGNKAAENETSSGSNSGSTGDSATATAAVTETTTSSETTDTTTSSETTDGGVLSDATETDGGVLDDSTETTDDDVL